jgi:hypothetical protein
MTQFLRDQASDSEEVVTPLMLDGTYLSRNFATLGPLTWQPPSLKDRAAKGGQVNVIGPKGAKDRSVHERRLPSSLVLIESMPTCPFGLFNVGYNNF